MAKTIDIEVLRGLLRYDPETGELFWKVDRRGFCKAGDPAGCAVADGRVVVKVLGSIFKRARLAWVLHHGVWPSGVIDHWDTDPSNDRIANLRDIPRGWNQQNQRDANCRSRSGLLGVRPAGDRFQAQIKVQKKSVYLGTFDTAEAAHEAYVKAKRDMHPGCTL